MNVIGLLLSSLLVAGADDAVQQDFDRLQGTWVVVAAERDGQLLDRIKGNQMIIKDRNFTIKTKTGFEMKGDLILDPGKKPRHMDLAHQEGLLRDKTWQAIYQLDGAELKICYVEPDAGKERPKEFTTQADSGMQLVVLKREKL